MSLQNRPRLYRLRLASTSNPSILRLIQQTLQQSFTLDCQVQCHSRTDLGCFFLSLASSSISQFWQHACLTWSPRMLMFETSIFFIMWGKLSTSSVCCLMSLIVLLLLNNCLHLSLLLFLSLYPLSSLPPNVLLPNWRARLTLRYIMFCSTDWQVHLVHLITAIVISSGCCGTVRSRILL